MNLIEIGDPATTKQGILSIGVLEKFFSCPVVWKKKRRKSEASEIKF